MYKRVLLKLSGEQLAGEFENGVDTKVAKYIAEEVKKAQVSGCQMVVVVGGGNLVRGAEVAKHGIKRVTGDHMGMLSGLINAMALTDIFEHNGLETRCMSNIFADQVAEMYSFRRAEKHLDSGKVIIVAGGIGRPYFTHDTAAVNIALELGCDAVLKATKVDGVYDKDPNKYQDAVKYDTLNYQQALESVDIKVMDKAAIGLAMEQKMAVVVFDLDTENNILRAASGENVGTIVS
ncbi:MAG: UMP kinase [Candidatus Saccharimonadales bacterium]